jgi:hypothetical protein
VKRCEDFKSNKDNIISFASKLDSENGSKKHFKKD